MTGENLGYKTLNVSFYIPCKQQAQHVHNLLDWVSKGAPFDPLLFRHNEISHRNPRQVLHVIMASNTLPIGVGHFGVEMCHRDCQSAYYDFKVAAR